MTRRGPALLALFARADDLRAAVDAVRARGLPCAVHSPVRDERLQAALEPAPSPVRFVTLAGFLAGAAAGLGLCAFTALRWRFVVSGKPVLAWVPFTVIAFELSILLGVLATFAGMLLLARLPRRRSAGTLPPSLTGDRFGLLVPGGADDALAAALRAAGAEDVRVVEG